MLCGIDTRQLLVLCHHARHYEYAYAEEQEYVGQEYQICEKFSVRTVDDYDIVLGNLVYELDVVVVEIIYESIIEGIAGQCYRKIVASLI